MPKVGIVTDSTCDIEPSQLAEIGVEMVPLTVHFGDEHFRDWIDLRPLSSTRSSLRRRCCRRRPSRHPPTSRAPTPGSPSKAPRRSSS